MIKIDSKNKTITIIGSMSVTEAVDTLQSFNREGWTIQPGTETKEDHFIKPAMPSLDPTGDEFDTLKDKP